MSFTDASPGVPWDVGAREATVASHPTRVSSADRSLRPPTVSASVAAMPFPLRVSFPCFARARQTEPHKRARKLSRVERELASLAPWAWDPLVGKHAPGNAMMRDFAEVAADKVVTTNTDTYDAFRFAAPETNAETKETSAKKRDRTRASSVAVAATALDREPPRSILNRKARSARPPACRPPTAAAAPRT